MRRYGAIVADPPWAYRSKGDHLRATFDHRPKSFDAVTNTAGSDSRYGSMSMGELMSLDVGALADDNSHLYLWTTNSFMVEAHALCRAWGFEPKTILTWVKVKPDGAPSARLGYYFRGATEHVVFGVRGRQRLLVNRAVPNVLMTRRVQRHSAKPVEMFDLVEEVSPGPYLEMFARDARKGWDHWGNELATDVVVPVKEGGAC